MLLHKYTWLGLLSLTLLAIGCSSPEVKFSGPTQGTMYNIIYFDVEKRNFQMEIDSILQNFDKSLSTYISTSVISEINSNDTGGVVHDEFGYLETVMQESFRVHELTEGAFDPTVGPILKAWGIEDGQFKGPDSTAIDSLLQFVGLNDVVLYHDVELDDQLVLNKPIGLELNFNAIAQGYAVDVIGLFLESKGVNDYMVEIGGETLVKGQKDDGSAWTLGIEKPVDEAERSLTAKIQLTDRAVATSGSYRKYVEVDGVRYSHAINPNTGRPVTHSLLSATVVADECMRADAFATAFLVMGIDNTAEFLFNRPELGLEVYLIYEGEKGDLETWSSEGIKELLVN